MLFELKLLELCPEVQIKIPSQINDTELYKYAGVCSSVTVVKRIAENILLEPIEVKEEIKEMLIGMQKNYDR